MVFSWKVVASCLCWHSSSSFCWGTYPVFLPSSVPYTSEPVQATQKQLELVAFKRLRSIQETSRFLQWAWKARECLSQSFPFNFMNVIYQSFHTSYNFQNATVIAMSSRCVVSYMEWDACFPVALSHSFKRADIQKATQCQPRSKKQTPAKTLSPFLRYEEFHHEWFDVVLAGQINIGKNGPTLPMKARHPARLNLSAQARNDKIELKVSSCQMAAWVFIG